MDSGNEIVGRAVTIYDVATAAGVAPSTVSRALARPGRVSAVTAAKVRRAAAELGYQRSSAAPTLPHAPSRRLAMLVADIANPVFVEVIRGAEAAAEAADHSLVLIDTRESSVRERLVEPLLPMLDGLLLTSPRLSDSGIRMLAKQRPVVVLNRIVQGLPSVLTDSARGARRAVEHLGALGHEEVTYLAGPEASWTDGVRWRSIQEAGMELYLRTRRIGPQEPTIQGGLRAARRWAAQPTTAVVAFNDVMAIGFIQGLRALGIEVPGEVSVVGFDNSQVGSLTTPALTSVASPLRSQGATATRNLLAIIGGARPTSEPVLLPVKLVPRASTGKARPGRLVFR
ncbi:LacI family DNA-binding transcriptional regulator [Pseudactinotalea sp. HY158]|uniref:LacI family DNA-binding transcriptional regulator n=1 Tax=Pseudactinotalea sp. HY158 TaxID=2654547 RepID=UPI00129CEA29|nr:LacI family DNA-binding transcriptional regulator [Pseudactinotalea sp. HY158]QGH69499.1 LacI family DNA-binding transcriptional regulator [Pseudactinotalea sp. HY158]